MQTRIRIAATAITAAAVAMLGGLGTASSALAHTSAFTGHYTLSGDYWQLVYKGPLDQYSSNCGGTGHFHDVNHNYRSVPNQGPYNFYHQQFHFAGCGGAASQVGELSSEPQPEPQPSSAELAAERSNADARRTICLRSDAFCASGSESDAPAVLERLRDDYPVRVLTLTGIPAFGGEQYIATESREPAAATCAISLLNAAGLGPALAADLKRGITVEVVDRGIAERLGHPC